MAISNDRLERRYGPAAGTGASAEPQKRRIGPMVVTFVIMAITWVVLSGQFDPFHLSLGVISCSIVAWFSSDLLFPPRESSGPDGTWIRFCLYIPWLLVEIFKANLWLLYLVFHPRMMDLIDPKIIKFDTRLRKTMSRLTFANSITLTPGTITVYVDVDGRYTVHAIDDKSAAGLPGEMEEKVAKTFGE
ncbi:multicomponent Na+:H+ antiporter subunit E [Desulfobaculum xiamenense]|uniref:Multicomponent Na+:H+ antiporter subunit E n=1 Tax=Desulfobaculum xiamenense TaxID=995050 RepID=A0A846QFK4_9BACT|nr:Na+/H+ antiporter subunit E [Desulfobaculum xiamenense]NJB67108.1 multicomponent Na+:H+ antiporter subunit E [Desulfobaculum xiamenense]